MFSPGSADICRMPLYPRHLIPFQLTVILLSATAAYGQGIITTLAGAGSCTYSGDGGLASTVGVCVPTNAAVDGFGNIYFADSHNFRIRKISTNGVITTIAGNGIRGSSGDGGPALSASIGYVYQLDATISSRVFFADPEAHKLRAVNLSTGVMEGYGTGDPVSAGDGGMITTASFRSPTGIAIYPRFQAPNVGYEFYVSDPIDNLVRKIDGFTES